MKIDYSKNTIFNINKLQTSSYVKSNTQIPYNIIHILEYDDLRTFPKNEHSIIEDFLDNRLGNIIEDLKDHNISHYINYIQDNYKVILEVLETSVKKPDYEYPPESLSQIVKLNLETSFPKKDSKFIFILDILKNHETHFKNCILNILLEQEEKSYVTEFMEVVFDIHKNDNSVNIIKYNNIIKLVHKLLKTISTQVYNHVNFLSLEHLNPASDDKYCKKSIVEKLNDLKDDKVLVFLQEFYNSNIFIIDSKTREPYYKNKFYKTNRNSMVLLFNTEEVNYERIGFYTLNRHVKRIFERKDEILHLFIN